jgi:hypothetical protein
VCAHIPKDDFTEALRAHIARAFPTLTETSRTEPDLTALSYSNGNGRAVWIATHNREATGIEIDLEVETSDRPQTVTRVIAADTEATVRALRQWLRASEPSPC